MQELLPPSDNSIAVSSGNNNNNNNHNNNNHNNNNRMHGQLPRNLDEMLMDTEQSHRWLKSGDMKGETESKIVAAQDEVISTNCFKNKILKEETESKCRLCKQHEETIDHLTSGCPIVAKNRYLMRHDKVCTYLHYSICKALGIETHTNGIHWQKKST